MSITKPGIGLALLAFVPLAGMLAGCAVPPGPARAPTNRSVQEDNEEGWLWRRMTGQQRASANQAPPYAPPQQPGPQPNPAAPVQAAASPRDLGVVPIGAAGAAEGGRDIVPASLTTPATAPGVPGASTVEAQPAPTGGVPVNVARAKKDDDNGFDWSDLAPEKTWKRLKEATGYGADEPIARKAMQDGEAQFRERKYAEAAKNFYAASWRWPDSMLEEDAMFMLAESYFFDDRYSAAHDAYTNLLKKYDNTRYLDTVMVREFAIGRYWEQADLKQPRWVVIPNATDKTRPWFDDFGNAMHAYQQIRLHDPTGPLADQSIMATANAQFRKRNWEEAERLYNLLRKEYPKSQFQKEAHMLGLQSAMQTYQGPYYEKQPLDRAKEYADQTLTQFRGRLGDEEQRIVEQRAKIVAEQAERVWMMGQYYEKKSAYGAARHYYRSVIEQYPTTPLAERARTRLEEIKDKPDNPPDRFGWLKMLERKR